MLPFKIQESNKSICGQQKVFSQGFIKPDLNKSFSNPCCNTNFKIVQEQFKDQFMTQNFQFKQKFQINNQKERITKKDQFLHVLSKQPQNPLHQAPILNLNPQLNFSQQETSISSLLNQLQPSNEKLFIKHTSHCHDYHDQVNLNNYNTKQNVQDSLKATQDYLIKNMNNKQIQDINFENIQNKIEPQNVLKEQILQNFDPESLIQLKKKLNSQAQLLNFQTKLQQQYQQCEKLSTGIQNTQNQIVLALQQIQILRGQQMQFQGNLATQELLQSLVQKLDRDLQQKQDTYNKSRETISQFYNQQDKIDFSQISQDIELIQDKSFQKLLSIIEEKQSIKISESQEKFPQNQKNEILEKSIELTLSDNKQQNCKNELEPTKTIKHSQYNRRGKPKLSWACKHSNSIHYSGGMCQQCYLADYYTKRKDSICQKKKLRLAIKAQLRKQNKQMSNTSTNKSEIEDNQLYFQTT